MDVNEQKFWLVRWALLENIVTVIGTVVLVLGLYAMGAGGWSACGLALMLNINTPRSTLSKQ